MNIRTEKVAIPVGEHGKMTGYLAVPEGAGPFPVVVVIEEIFGVNQHIRDVTERIAKEGYVAIAPDIHHRELKGAELGYSKAEMQRGMQLIPKLTQEGVRDDLEAALRWVQARKDVRGDRVGVVGFCIGGHLAYYAAATLDVKATASFYGAGIANFSPGGGPSTLTKTKDIRGKIVCFFGENDPSIPQAQIEALRAELEKHSIRHEIITYSGASHAFFCDKPERGSYHAQAAADAWERVKKLFKEELKA